MSKGSLALMRPLKGGEELDIAQEAPGLNRLSSGGKTCGFLFASSVPKARAREWVGSARIPLYEFEDCEIEEGSDE